MTNFWMPIETAPHRHGVKILVYGPDLVHEDFNPSGIVEALWQDDEGFLGAVWDGSFDCWMPQPIEPTHWLPYPEPPSMPSDVLKIVRAAADADPITHDGEQWSYCFFCGVDAEGVDPDHVQHKDDCVWILARDLME